MKLEEKKYTRKTNDVPHPRSITGYQVDNLPNTSSSFRIVSFRSLILFLLFFGLGFIYQSVVEKKEADHGKNLLSELLIGAPSVSL